MNTIKVVNIGSLNPVKFKSVKNAFSIVWPLLQFSFQSKKILSNVSSQPLSDEETIKGATHRAIESLKDADFGVGLEGGVHQIGNQWFSFGWSVIVSRSGETGIGSSPRILLPTSITYLIKKGFELAEINDKLFDQKNSGKDQGNFGLMTNGVITRQSAYQEACILALTRFNKSNIYKDH
jgi:inosine/xanthosine triphosphatase